MEEDGKCTSLHSRWSDKLTGYESRHLEMEQRKEIKDCLLVFLASMVNRVMVTDCF